MIPGLLATSDYIRQSVADVSGDQRRLVAKKIERQGVLDDPSRKFIFILTEQAVRWPLISADGMVKQIDHLISVTRKPNIRLGVLPLSNANAVRPLNTYYIYDHRLVMVETLTGELALKDQRDVAAYREEFDQCQQEALFADAAAEQLEAWRSFAGS
jgi:hypothetical protein